jgi:hypothetical protein
LEYERWELNAVEVLSTDRCAPSYVVKGDVENLPAATNGPQSALLPGANNCSDKRPFAVSEASETPGGRTRRVFRIWKASL